jgi:hypothetical protein
MLLLYQYFGSYQVAGINIQKTEYKLRIVCRVIENN